MEKFEEFNKLAIKQLEKVGYYSDTIANTSKENSKFLSAKGWVECNYSKHWLPEEYTEKCLSGYGGTNYTVSKYYANNKKVCTFDTVLKKYFYGATCHQVYIKDNKESIADSHLSYLLNNGKMHAATITRNRKIFVDFNPYYYDNHSSPKNWTVPANDAFGIELELKFPDALSKLKFSCELNKNFPGWNCERDGSLEDIEGPGNAGDGGLELISPPLSFSDHCGITPQIISLARERGAIGHDTGSKLYGLHITHKFNHKNISAPANFMRFLHDHTLEDFWRNFSRRDRNKYCSTFDKVDDDLERDARYSASDGYGDMYTFTKGYNKSNHYRATCVRESLTALETRIFRSTINHNTILASIEIVHLINKVAEAQSYNRDAYIGYIVKNRSSKLRNYMKKCGSELSIEQMQHVNQYSDNDFQ